MTFVGGASPVGVSSMRDGSSEGEEELNGISEDVGELSTEEVLNPVETCSYIWMHLSIHVVKSI